MSQDFTKRISIVINRELESWQVLNTVSHISAYYGQKLGRDLTTGEFFKTADGIQLQRNSQYPIIALQANKEDLQTFAHKVQQDSDIDSMCFFREMIETTDDSEIVKSLSKKDFNEVEILGIGIFGENSEVKRMTSQFGLWS